MIKHLVAVLLALLLVMPVRAQGRSIIVDDDRAQCPQAAYTSISAAVQAATPGTTIRVCPGTYDGGVVIDKSQLTLQAQGAPRSVKVVASGTTLPRFGFAVFADDVAIEGFEISRFGEEPGGAGIAVGGIYMADGPELHPAKRATIKNNVIFGAREGLGISEGYPVLLLHSDDDRIENNELHHSNTGVTCDTSQHVLIRHNTMHDNGNWGVLGYACSGQIESNTIYRSAEEAVRVQESSGLVIDDNIFRDNFAGLYVGNVMDATIRQNDIATSGDALVVAESHGVVVERNVVHDNGTGISVVLSFDVKVEHNQSDRNVPAEDQQDTPDNPLPAGILVSDSSNISVGENQTNANGYGIRVANSTNNLFRHNDAHSNRVVDLKWDGNGVQQFVKNRCDTAIPSTEVWDCQ
jgi:parallel beta-helix repeat protein